MIWFEVLDNNLREYTTKYIFCMHQMEIAHEKDPLSIPPRKETLTDMYLHI